MSGSLSACTDATGWRLDWYVHSHHPPLRPLPRLGLPATTGLLRVRLCYSIVTHPPASPSYHTGTGQGAKVVVAVLVAAQALAEARRLTVARTNDQCLHRGGGAGRFKSGLARSGDASLVPQHQQSSVSVTELPSHPSIPSVLATASHGNDRSHALRLLSHCRTGTL